MGTIATLDDTGDTKSMWDKNNPTEVKAARKMFEDLTKQGFKAFKAVGEKGIQGELIRSFNPDHEKIIMVPPMAGG